MSYRQSSFNDDLHGMHMLYPDLHSKLKFLLANINNEVQTLKEKVSDLEDKNKVLDLKGKMKNNIIISGHIFEQYQQLDTDTLTDDEKLEKLIEAYQRTNNWQRNIDNLGGSFDKVKAFLANHPATHTSLIEAIKLFGSTTFLMNILQNTLLTKRNHHAN